MADGELVAVLGPSGSGKSTLLRMLVGLAEISAGELLLDGERATDWAPAERDLGIVFQDYAPYPHLSVRDNIAFPLRLARTPEDDVRRRVEAIAAELELTEHLSRWPSQLSGGQRQRVALGRVLVRRPAGYLLDEPLSTQDPPVRSRLLGLIARTGITTVYVTHDQGEAMALGGRVAVLWHGALQQVDTPEAVYERPANLVVASCVGAARGEPAARHGGRRQPAAADGGRAAGRVRPGAPRRAGPGAWRRCVPSTWWTPRWRRATTPRPASAFAARVESADWTGSELVTRLRYRDDGPMPAALAAVREEPSTAGEAGVLLARLGAGGPARDRPVARVWLDRRRILLFDADTGAALGSAAPPLPDDDFSAE